MIKKTLRNALVGTAAAGAMILPAATTVAPTIQNVACKYPKSIVTSTDLIAPTVIQDHDTNTATVDVDGQGGPNGTVRFKVVGPIKDDGTGGKKRKVAFKDVTNGEPVTFTFGGGFKAGKNYKLKAKFFGNCRYRNSSDALIVTVVKG